MGPMIVQYLAVMSGGALGVAGRMAMVQLMERWTGEGYPIGTMLVNILGCLIIGIFVGLTGPGALWENTSPVLRQAVVIGVLGGFTTFSSFSLQTILLLQQNQWFLAGGNVVLTVVFCLFSTWVGMQILGLFAPR
jgi:CrcB protein